MKIFRRFSTTILSLSILATGLFPFSALAALDSPLLPEAHYTFDLPVESTKGFPPELLPLAGLDKAIDSITLKILNTPTGQIFCEAVDKNVESVHNAFFIHRSAASEAMSICKKFAENPPHRPFPKKFAFIGTLDEKYDNTFYVNGWTNSHNKTFLFMTKSEILSKNSTLLTARLTQSLIHEMAVSFDRKEQIGYLGKIDWGQIGIAQDENTCTVLSILRNAYIKHFFTSLRAFEIEKAIATELGLSLPRGFANWKHLSCEAKLEFMFEPLSHFFEELEREDVVNQMYDVSICPAESQIVITKDKTSQITAIRKLARLNFVINGSTRNVCEFMSEGLPYIPGVSFRGGPGTRMGGSGWSKLESEKPEE